jgi:translation initiation factor 3 subunit J
MQSDWEASSDEEGKEAPPSVSAPPPKKKGTLKAKLTAKDAAKAARLAEDAEDADYHSDHVHDPLEKARQDKQREVNADLNNAADLFGAAALGGIIRHH